MSPSKGITKTIPSGRFSTAPTLAVARQICSNDSASAASAATYRFECRCRELKACGYVTVRNPDAKSDGRWAVSESGICTRKTPVFAKVELPLNEQFQAVEELYVVKPKGSVG